MIQTPHPSQRQTHKPIKSMIQKTQAIIAGDEGSISAGVTSPSPLFSLGTALLSSGSILLSLEPISLDKPGVRHEGSCHMIPVKLRSCRGLRSHLRHAAPVRSRARRPAFMAPVLAFGPRRWAAGSLSPSSLVGC
jgi:hypothetical protein